MITIKEMIDYTIADWTIVKGKCDSVSVDDLKNDIDRLIGVISVYESLIIKAMRKENDEDE